LARQIANARAVSLDFHFRGPIDDDFDGAFAMVTVAAPCDIRTPFERLRGSGQPR
jgi:hypothetical protein